MAFLAKGPLRPGKVRGRPAGLIDYYNEKGFYDARIVDDTVYLAENTEDPELIVKITVHEGPRYYIRNIEWEGNTVFPNEALTEALGFKKGDPFNRKKLEENLYGNKRSTDVSSLYMNRGYMLFRAEPTIRVVGRDSLDLHFDVYEGDVFEFGTINIAGNQKTKEHVIRRELYTIPGQTFSAMPSRSRSDAWRSSTTSTRKRWRPVPRCRSIRRKRRSI